MMEWIKCSERKPEIYVRVLFAASNKIFVGYCDSSDYCIDNQITDDDSMYSSYEEYHDFCQKHITHWMPLPKPPIESDLPKTANVGVFYTLEEAEKLAEILLEKGRWREGGQNDFKVFSLKEGCFFNEEYKKFIK